MIHSHAANTTNILRTICALLPVTYPAGQEKKVLADLSRSNERVREWHIAQESEIEKLTKFNKNNYENI
jgi:hypothetical protein